MGMSPSLGQSQSGSSPKPLDCGGSYQQGGGGMVQKQDLPHPQAHGDHRRRRRYLRLPLHLVPIGAILVAHCLHPQHPLRLLQHQQDLLAVLLMLVTILERTIHIADRMETLTRLSFTTG